MASSSSFMWPPMTPDYCVTTTFQLLMTYDLAFLLCLSTCTPTVSRLSHSFLFFLLLACLNVIMPLYYVGIEFVDWAFEHARLCRARNSGANLIQLRPLFPPLLFG